MFFINIDKQIQTLEHMKLVCLKASKKNTKTFANNIIAVETLNKENVYGAKKIFLFKNLPKIDEHLKQTKKEMVVEKIIPIRNNLLFENLLMNMCSSLNNKKILGLSLQKNYVTIKGVSGCYVGSLPLVDFLRHIKNIFKPISDMLKKSSSLQQNIKLVKLVENTHIKQKKNKWGKIKRKKKLEIKIKYED